MGSLEITFTGIAAIVPTSGNSYRIVFPSVCDPVAVHGSLLIPPHVLSVSYFVEDDAKVGKRQLITALDEPNLRIKRELGDQFAYLLEGQGLTLQGDNPVAQGVHFDTYRVIDVSVVQPKAAFDNNLASDAFDPDPARIAGWFDLTFGELKASDAAAATVEFKPKATPNIIAQDFAEAVVAIFPANVYTLYVRRFGSEDEPEGLLKIDATAVDRIQITIGNFPYDALVVPDSARVKARDNEILDHHFHLYYGLCCDDLDVHPLPNRISGPKAEHLANGINCPPAYFKK